jgi:hypothetical protein
MVRARFQASHFPNRLARYSSAAAARNPGSTRPICSAAAPRPRFFSVPEQVKFFMADKALSRQWFFCSTARVRFQFSSPRTPAASIRGCAGSFPRLEQMPFVIRRKNETVSPVRIVRHDAAAGRTADERTQQRRALNLGKFLEIAERRRRFRPAVKSQHRFAEAQTFSSNASSSAMLNAASHLPELRRSQFIRHRFTQRTPRKTKMKVSIRVRTIVAKHADSGNFNTSQSRNPVCARSSAGVRARRASG